MANREIKFRAWINGEMEYNHRRDGGNCCDSLEYTIAPSDKGIYIIRQSDCESTLEVELKLGIIMQYTGLKDKNGKEIYEGDILEFDKNEWGGEDNIHVVTWDNEDARWSWGGGITSDMDFRTVIGNIYENPELLK